jgi:N-acetylglucosaminyldiphosphoundecaprenol N-acetyl-beta-D-mannosaminyltransferase
LCRRYPGLRIAGTYAPPFGALSDEQQADMVARVRAARPDILFVAFGAPRQDLWIAEQQDVLKVPVCAGIGGSFDLIAGRLKRAPSWMQRMGLEWLYRLIQEPGRLWKRYLFGDLPLFLHILSSRFTARPERSV